MLVKLSKMVLILSIICINSYASNFQKSNFQIISLEDLLKSDYFRKINSNISNKEIMKKVLKDFDPNIVLNISKGEKLPLKIMLNGDYFELSENEGMYYGITLKKDLFIRLKNNKFLFSEDLEKWSEILPFFTGEASLAIVNSEENIPYIILGATVNKR